MQSISFPGRVEGLKSAATSWSNRGSDHIRLKCNRFRDQVIKQTIMTTVYGVTKYGARQQIRGQLEGIEDFPQKHTWEASFYLTDKTFKCLQQMFTSTKDIQASNTCVGLLDCCGSSVKMWLLLEYC